VQRRHRAFERSSSQGLKDDRSNPSYLIIVDNVYAAIYFIITVVLSSYHDADGAFGFGATFVLPIGFFQRT
jgi:hypothetical protein